VDTLGRLIKHATSLQVLQKLHPRRPVPEVSLYADDLVLFCHPTPEDLASVKAIFQLFGKASGLRVNYTKSTATLLNCTPDDATAVPTTLGCQLAELPITYLGIPLTIRRPTSAQLQPLITKAANMLPTWKSKLMNKTGRLALVKSVLSAIPIHQLMVLQPPKKTLKAFERIERGFFWEGKAAANGGNCHVNWQTVCRPACYDGLDIRDLERTGLALRLQWLWYSKTDDERAWQGLDLKFSEDEHALFFASTHLIPGNGQTGKFWEDRWINGLAIREIAPQLYACIHKHRRKARTIAAGLHEHAWARDIQGNLGIDELGQYLKIWRMLEPFQLNDQPDQLTWKWTADGDYSAKSCYLATFHGSIKFSPWKLIWKTWAPPRIRFFLWQALKNRCWTADRLQRRHLPHPPRCVLCDQEQETMHHLLITCPFSRQVWHDALSSLQMTCQPPNHEASLDD
jgi:hypothetical protein